MPSLGIVIPALGAVDRLEQTLLSILENRPSDCEVLVALAAPYDDPYGLAGDIRYVNALAAASWVEAANSGIAASSAEIIHLLDCGTEVSDGWTTPVMELFEDDRVGAVSPLIVREAGKPCVAGVGYKASGVRTLCATRGDDLPAGGSKDILGPTRAASFYRRTALECLGKPYDTSLGDELADVDLALRLRSVGFACKFEPRCIVRASSGSQPSLDSAFSRGRRAERLFWRSAPNIGRFAAIAGHGAILACELASCLIRPTRVLGLAGRAAAWLEIADYRRHYIRLRMAARLCEQRHHTCSGPKILGVRQTRRNLRQRATAGSLRGCAAE